MRSLVIASLVGIFSVSVVACSSPSTGANVESGGAAVSAPPAQLDAYAQGFVGTWDRVNFISPRKENKSVVFHKNGTYDATKNDDSKEHGTFSASESKKSVTLTPTGGEARTFKVYIQPNQELYLAITGDDATESEDAEVFLFNESAPADEPEGEPGSGVDVACEARTGGAYITIETADVPYTIWSTNAAFIARAKIQQQSGASKVALFSKLFKGEDCNSGIKLYPDPNDMKWVDTAVEVCDAEPIWLNGNINYMVDTVGYWCPWHTKVTKVDER